MTFASSDQILNVWRENQSIKKDKLSKLSETQKLKRVLNISQSFISGYSQSYPNSLI